jgi:hypothetical protein
LEVGVSDNEALGGPGPTYVSFVLLLKEVLVNEERCEGRNEKQGEVGAQTGLYEFLGNVAV